MQHISHLPKQHSNLIKNYFSHFLKFIVDKTDDLLMIKSYRPLKSRRIKMNVKVLKGSDIIIMRVIYKMFIFLCPSTYTAMYEQK